MVERTLIERKKVKTVRCRACGKIMKSEDSMKHQNDTKPYYHDLFIVDEIDKKKTETIYAIDVTKERCKKMPDVISILNDPWI